MRKQFLIDSIIEKDDNTNILRKDTNYLIEKLYSGSYADMTSDEELSLLNELKQNEWRNVVINKLGGVSSWLYKIITDKGRASFLNLLNLPKGGVFLDVGSGWGQISIPLSKYGNTICLDLTKNRLDILNEISKQEGAKLNFVQGNYLTFPFKESVFDLIIFNGSLEWISVGRDKEKSIRSVQVSALKKARNILKENGQIYIGIENSMGLKYILGSPDDHTGISHITYLPENLANKIYSDVNKEILPVKTWDLDEYKSIFNEARLTIEKIYCCFPDYKLIRKMIDIKDINHYIQDVGLLINEHNGIDGTPFFDAEKLDALYKQLAKNNIAHLFCPSYGFVLKKERTR